MELEIHSLEIHLIVKVDGAVDTFWLEIQLIEKVVGAGDTFVTDTTD